MKKSHPDAPTLLSYAAVAARRESVSAPPPRVSIITVVRNGAATVSRTTASVQAQQGPTIEHVVVDGGSTDGTQAFLERHLRAQDFWISEPDRGIADAFNKGVALARGTYVQFLNADDWLSDGQLAQAVDTLERTGADFVFGDLVFYRDGRPTYVYKGDPAYAAGLRTHLPPVNHPTLLARRELFERAGLFCLEHRYSMEYDWLQRVHSAGGQGVYDARIVGHMTHEGVSNLAFRRTAREVRDIAIAHGATAWRACVRAELAIAKTALSHWVRAGSPRLYDSVRSRLNAAYVPLGTPQDSPR